MFDVVPPSFPRSSGRDKAESSSRRARPIRPAVTSRSSRGDEPVSSGPRVVEVDWRLPARLRKPVRYQLAKERAQRQRRAAAVQFNRRVITTRPVFRARGTDVEFFGKAPGQMSGLQLPKRRIFNRGAEHHTGDTYRYTQPQLQVAIPPYMGSAAAPVKSRAANPKRPTNRSTQSVAPIEGMRMRKKSMRMKQRSFVRTPPPAKPVIYSERDVAFNWQAADRSYEPQTDLFADVPEEVVKKPRRWFIPFRFSIFPHFLFGKQKQADSSVAQSDATWEREAGPAPVDGARMSKKKVFAWNDRRVQLNLAILFVASLAVIGLVWNLQGVGRGLSVLSSVEDRSKQALGEVLAAQSALANTDFAGSDESFAHAGLLLGDARRELEQALSASRYVLTFLDVTGTVRSGENLLAVGEDLTEAGQHVSRALLPFTQTGNVLGDVATPAPDGAVAGAQTISLVEAIRQGQTELGQAIPKLTSAEDGLANIKSPFLPSDVVDQLGVLGTSVPRVRDLLQKVYDQSNSYLYLLGADHDRQYLVLFANNDELRPVGGFIGTVGLVNVDRGRVENIDVNSVYDGDGQLKDYIAPPDPLLSIVDRWYLRDANWFVDYPASARKVADFFEKEGGPTVDGVIMLTPDVIQRLLTITGPVTVPGYDVQVSADNFVEVTQGEVTYNYDKELNKPKQFLADLTPLLLNKLFAADSTEGKLQVLGALADSISQKDMSLYFRDKEAEQQLKDLGWSGSVPPDKSGFLTVNNANVGGHKSDQFIDQEIDYRSDVQDNGDVDVTVTIRREHKGPQEKLDFDYPDNENPAFKDNVVYQRVLVPMGATLLEANGFTPAADVPKTVIPEAGLPFEADPDLAKWQSSQTQDANGTMIGQEAGYTFFANWIVTKPGQTTVSLYRYRIPHAVAMPNLLNPAQTYSTYIYKQAGARRTTVRTSMTVPNEYRIIHTVPDNGVTQDSDTSIVYRGDLKQDMVVGAVFEKAE